MLNSEGWRETKRIMYALYAPSACVFFIFSYLNLCNNSKSILTLWGVVSVDDGCVDLEMDSEFWDF